MNSDQTATLHRCDDVDVDAGRCQLQNDHHGVHAADDVTAWVTWQYGVVCRWPINPPPFWMLQLPWSDMLTAKYQDHGAA